MNPLPDRTVHVVVPAMIDDPARPSGGNVYDRRLLDELPAFGWAIHEHPVRGSWPTPASSDRDAFDALLMALPDDALVLVDGLIASGAPGLVPAARRLRVAVLVHMPDATDRVEADVLQAAAAVITTSRWSRDRVIAQHALPADRVWVATPGVDPAPAAVGSTSGRNLLVVGPITPAKGYDLLVSALADVADLDWRCTCVGSLDLAPDFVARLTASAADAGIADRLTFTGPLTRPALDELRSHTDLVISASRREAYGMAVAEGLAAGIPAIATDIGGQPEAVGVVADGKTPGALVPVDAERLASALRRWLTDPETRARWRDGANLRRGYVAGWPETARIVSAALSSI